MKLSRRWIRLVILAAALGLAGCSYTPARIDTGPLIEIDGGRGYHYPHRHYDRDDWDDWDDHYDREDWEDRYDRDARYQRERYRRPRHWRPDDHRPHGRYYRGSPCPPGLAKQGRC